MSRACNIRIALVPTTRTDLMCCACGSFRTQYAVDVPGQEPQVGLHQRCMPALRVRGAPRGATVPAADEDEQPPEPCPAAGVALAPGEASPWSAPARCTLCKAKPGTHLAGCPGDVAAQVQP